MLNAAPHLHRTLLQCGAEHLCSLPTLQDIAASLQQGEPGEDQGGLPALVRQWCMHCPLSADGPDRVLNWKLRELYPLPTQFEDLFQLKLRYKCPNAGAGAQEAHA